MVIGSPPTPHAERMPDDLTLGGLLALLEAEEEPLPRRHRPARMAAFRPLGAGRSWTSPATRPVPVAAPRPAPAARPAPSEEVAPGTGPDAGSAVPAAAARRPAVRTRLRVLARRLALWGAGPDGRNLAWGRPVPTAAAPSSAPATRTASPIQPAASSPAAALLPAGRARSAVPPIQPAASSPAAALLPAGRARSAVPPIQPAASSPAAALLRARLSRPPAGSRVPVVPPLARQAGSGRSAGGGRDAPGSARARGDPPG